LYDEIKNYPRPIPACDLQFNHLLEEREGLLRELDRMNEAIEVGRAGGDPFGLLEEFLRSSRHIDEGTKEGIVSSLKEGRGEPAACAGFYDGLAPFYHLIFPDWEASIRGQAAALDGIFREHWGGGRLSVLDVACGVGTQALGLAALGHAVTASDLSPAAVARAEREARQRSLRIDFSVADMRQAWAHHRRQFDVVIACDNAVPHLLTDEELLTAFGQMFACTRPGGGCLVSVRDYDREDRSGVQVKPYGVRAEGDRRYLVFQVWEFHGLVYDLAMYFVEDRGGSDCVAHVMRSRYYAVGTDTLLALMRRAGFSSAERLDGRFFQPVLLGRKS
jgi:SAM-dependent methyltransferase